MKVPRKVQYVCAGNGGAGTQGGKSKNLKLLSESTPVFTRNIVYFENISKIFFQ